MDIESLRQGYIQRSMGNPGMAQQQPEPRKKNFWLDQISTAGGIVGGIAGLPLGILGAGGGAAIGSGLGETLENALTGDPLTKNVGKEAALGGVFGAGPLRLLKGAGGAAKALATGADDVVGAAARAAGTPLRQRAGQALAGGADDFAVKAFRLNPSQLRNFKGKFGEDAGTVIRKYGITSADDVSAKAIQPLQQQFDELVVGIPGVTKENLRNSLMRRVSTLAKSAPSDSKALGKSLKSEVDSLLRGRGDVIDAQELNSIRRQFDSLVNYTEKTANPARYGINKRMADGIRETLQKADPTGQLKSVGRELQKLRQLSDNIGKQSELGRGSLPFGITNLLGGGVGAGAGGLPGAAAGMATAAAVNSPAGRRVAMQGAASLGNRLSQSGARAAGAGTARGVVGRVGGAGLVRGATGQPQSLEDVFGQSPQSMSATMAPATTSTTPSNIQNMDTLNPQSAQQSSPYTRENLMSDIQRDPSNADKYIAYYQSLEEIFNPQPEAMELNNTAIARISDYESGIQALGELESRIGASGANAPVIGNLRRLNPLDTEAQDLNSVIRSVRQLVGKALEGGVLRREDEIKYQEMLPKIGDTDATARAKIANVRRLLESNLTSFMQNSQRFGGGGSLEDVLTAPQPAY